jgi:type VI secretion system protein ImpJ
MKSLSRIVWTEGMHLGPHHFQAQNRYFEDSIQFATSALWFATYGLVGCELSAEALRNGSVSVSHARGIFPDGLVFEMPECDPLPEARQIAELFPPTRDHLTVLLAIARHKPDGVNCAVSDGAEPDGLRYIGETKPLYDETTGRDERPVRLGRKNIRLMLDTESTEELATLPIARIMRSGSGYFVFDPEFIPPCLQIPASERLMSMLGRLIEILEEKAASLALPKQAGGDKAAFSTREIANFWFLHTVNASLAPLRHLYLSKRGHPEELYLEMLRMAGALCTFALDSHPRSLPLYDHDHLDVCFAGLDRHIRNHLEVIVPTNCIAIPLHAAGNYLYFGEITDARCLGRSQWILAIRSKVGDAELISRTPQLVKVCSKQFVPELVRRALPGMQLTHLPTPPAAVSPKVEYQYFSVGKGGPCWDHLIQTKAVGVYVPGEFPDAEVELLAVIDS